LLEFLINTQKADLLKIADSMVQRGENPDRALRIYD